MDFNIKKYIDSLKEKTENQSSEKDICFIISKYLNINIDIHCKVKNGIVSFENISPILRTKIKLKKKELIDGCKKENIFIRDII